MLKFAIKNMLTKKIKVLFLILSVVITASVALLAYNVSRQIEQGIVNTAAYYDMIIGPSGSSTQLAMNTMFFTDKPLGTISYEYVEKLQADTRVNAAIPIAMGDSYNSARIVGTKSAFLADKPLRAGDLFDGVYEAVIGSGVAEKYGLTVGAELITSHGLSEGGSEHAATPLTVVGILDRTKTAYDNVVFTDIETVWAIHGHEEDHEDGHEEESGTHTDETDGAHEEGHAEEGTVCAILVKSKSFSDYYAISAEYSADASLLVINPSTVLREVLENVDLSRRIVYVLCIIILVMNIFVVTVITLLNMYDSRPEIALMRLIGIGSFRVNLLYLIQNMITGLLSCALALGMSRLILRLLGGYAATMGIVLDTARVYPAELAILGILFVVSVLPTFVCTLLLSRRDVIRN